MREEKKADGFKYDFTFSEMKALLFQSKKCPECSGQLTREKTCERVEGRDVNSKSDPFFVQNAQVNHYGFLFRCQNCGRVFTLQELAERAD
ncbi:MAG: hypothetical protein LUE89_09100 [Clostridiales bacterium]|nr:hypothetical protein [Clostridiales bacterium]